MATRNYYVVLGIASDESEQGVRAAYRDLARRYHPDLAGIDRLLSTLQSEVAAIADDLFRGPRVEQPADGSSARLDTDQVPVDLVGCEWVLEDVGIRDRLNDRTLQGGAARLGAVGAAPPYLSRRG